MKKEKKRQGKIIKKYVDGLELPESGVVFHWDSELKGFGVKLTPTGRVYVAQGRIEGRSIRVTIGKHGVITADQARGKAKKTLAGFLDGIDPAKERKRDEALSISLKQVVADYIADRGDKLRPASIADIRKHLNKSFDLWADKPIVSITRDKVAARHKELTKRSPAQADQAFRILKALINYTMARYRPEDEPIIMENVVSVLDHRQRNLWNRIKPRGNRIPDDKIGIAWNILQSLRAAPEQTRSSRTSADIVCFLLLTGCRWREGAELTWDRVSLDGGYFHLPDPKNRRPITIPISATLIEILKLRPRLNEYVFPSLNLKGHATSARTPLLKISEAAGIKICNHDLRRTFTNIALKKCRIDLAAIRLLTNHKANSDVTLHVYGDSADVRFLKPEAEKISNFIVEQGKIASAPNVLRII